MRPHHVRIDEATTGPHGEESRYDQRQHRAAEAIEVHVGGRCDSGLVEEEGTTARLFDEEVTT